MCLIYKFATLCFLKYLVINNDKIITSHKKGKKGNIQGKKQSIEIVTEGVLILDLEDEDFI